MPSLPDPRLSVAAEALVRAMAADTVTDYTVEDDFDRMARVVLAAADAVDPLRQPEDGVPIYRFAWDGRCKFCNQRADDCLCSEERTVPV